MGFTAGLDAEAIYRTLADLIAINSVNPNYPGGPGEGAIANYISLFFKKHSIAYEVQPVVDGRPNVIAKVEGGPGSPTLILEAHTDTASELGMSIPPFDPVRKGNLMYGRGSCDTKGGLAAMMHALKAVQESKRSLKCTVLLVAAADEEYSFRGVVKFLEKGVKSEGAVVAEPTELQIAVASKGALRFSLRTAGRAAHSSRPMLGVNAITKMANLVMAMERTLPAIFQKRHHPLVGSPTLNIGVIEGGTQSNQVPESCMIGVDRRLIPGETCEEAMQEVTSLISSLKARDPELQVSVKMTMQDDPPFETPPAARIVQVISTVLEKRGGNNKLIAVPFGSDASKFSRGGIPSVILGPGSIDRAHAAEEYVELDQVALAAETYRQVIHEF
jgi:acetylornithine deacetylase/succinyl-diaminopimelate desuccinylase family protein